MLQFKARIGEIEDQKTSLAHEDTNHPLEKPKRYKRTLGSGLPVSPSRR